jgi:hypothetical protein
VWRALPRGQPGSTGDGASAASSITRGPRAELHHQSSTSRAPSPELHHQSSITRAPSPARCPAARRRGASRTRSTVGPHRCVIYIRDIYKTRIHIRIIRGRHPNANRFCGSCGARCRADSPGALVMERAQRAPSPEVHEQSSITRGPRAELHHQRSTSRAPSPEVHEQSSITRAPRAELHHQSSTSRAPSPELHHQSSITSPVPGGASSGGVSHSIDRRPASMRDIYT